MENSNPDKQKVKRRGPASELRTVCLADVPLRPPEIPSKNEWRLDRGRWLVHSDPWYEIDLETCKSAESMLDWIFQIFEKSWCTARTIHDLLDCFDRRLSPQSTLCGGGIGAGHAAARRAR